MRYPLTFYVKSLPPNTGGSVSSVALAIDAAFVIEISRHYKV